MTGSREGMERAGCRKGRERVECKEGKKMTEVRRKGEGGMYGVKEEDGM